MVSESIKLQSATAEDVNATDLQSTNDATEQHSITSLFCTRSPLFPPIGGAPLRNRQNLEALSKLGPVSVFSIFKGNLSQLSSSRCVNQDLIRDWTHFDLNTCQRSLSEKLRRRLHWLRPDGHYYTDWIYTQQAAEQFQQCLSQLQPDLIVLEELWLYPYLAIARQHRQKFPHCRIILDNHNVEGDLAQERIPPLLKRREWLQLKRWELSLRPKRVRRMERQALAQVDQLWVCSPEDAAAMAKLYGSSQASKLCIVPNGVHIPTYINLAIPIAPIKAETLRATPPVQSTLPTEIQPEERVQQKLQPPKVLFLGSFAYRPNEIAARILIEEIYPQLRDRIPNLRLQLVGSEPPAWMTQAASDQIEVTGRVDSVLPYLQQASVMIVPLRHGSGTRLKLLEAFAAQLPVVSTAKGAEGLAVRDGEHLLLREDAADLAAGAEELLKHPARGQQLAQAAHQLVADKYSWATVNQTIQTAVLKMF